MTRRTTFTILALLGLVLAVKLALVLSVADVFFYGEELEKGTAAKAIIDGVDVPHYKLAYHYYEGGGFTISHLTALAFKVVGQNLWAHKLVSIGMNLCIALVGMLFMRKHWGLGAAVSFGLLFTFAPLVFQKISLLNLGIHYEASLFLLLVFHFGSTLLFDKSPKRASIIGFGLSAGFGTFFNYGILPLTAFWIGLLLLFKSKALKGRGAVQLSSSLLVGLLPFILMWSAVGDEVFDIHGSALFGGEQVLDDSVEVDVDSPTLAVIAEPETSGLEDVQSFCLILFEQLSAIQVAFFALWLLLPILGLRLLQKRGDKQALYAYLTLVGYLGCFAMLYVMSPFVVKDPYHHFLFQRLTPFWILGLCLTSATIGMLLSGKGTAQSNRTPRLIGTGLLALLGLSGATASLQAMGSGTGQGIAANSALLSQTKGYTYDGYFAKFIPHLEGTRTENLRTLLEFDEPARSLIYADAAAAMYRRSADTPEDIMAALQAIDAANFMEFVPGLGPYLHYQVDGRMKLAIHTALQMPPDLRKVFLEALGRRGLYIHPPAERLVREIEKWSKNPPPYPYYRGLGYRAYEAFRLDPGGAEDFINALPVPLDVYVRAGYEASRAEHQIAPTSDARDS
ncbi:MAG: hypothetical protein ACI8TQ_001113 [Planctomycetota bacterium]|jgi:hypothetical protein